MDPTALVTTNDAATVNGHFRQFLKDELDAVAPRARLAEQAVYGCTVDRVMGLLAPDLPPLCWSVSTQGGDDFRLVGKMNHSEYDVTDRYRVLRLWTYRYGCGRAEIRYRDAIQVRALLDVRGVRCAVTTQIWGPEDTCPRPRLRTVRQLASPRPLEPSVSELITRYQQLRMPEPVAGFVRPELGELASEVTERRSELNSEELRSWEEFLAAHPVSSSPPTQEPGAQA